MSWSSRQRSNKLFAAHMNQIGQDSSKLTVEERKEKLAEFLSFATHKLTIEEKQIATDMLKANHDCFSLDEGEIGITEGIEVEIETEGMHPIRQPPCRLAYSICDEVKVGDRKDAPPQHGDRISISLGKPYHCRSQKDRLLALVC